MSRPNIPDHFHSLGLLQYRTYDLSAHRSDLAALRHFEGSVALSTTCPRHSHRLRLGVEPNSRSTALCVTKATEQHHIGVIDGPSFKRCAPLGMWQRSSTRTYHMPCIASQCLPALCLARPSRNCPAATAQRAPLDSSLHHMSAAER